MHSIVTGASGFLGSALCRELLEHGEIVTAVIRPDSVKREKLELLMQESSEYSKRFKVLEIELEKIQGLWTEYHIQADMFYHLAWNGSLGEARNSFDIQYTNIQYTANAVQAAKLCCCKKFVGAGSQAEYGIVRGKAWEDKTVPDPFMMYGAAKLAAFQMAQVFAKQMNIQFVWPRIYSVYGPGENSETLVSYMVDMLKNGRVPKLTACENMWNYMYISDCVKALRLLGETEGIEGVFHVASKDSRPLKEFVEIMRDIISPDAKLGFGQKVGELERTFWLEPDVGKLESIGFHNEVGFEEGIQRKLGGDRKHN